MTHVKTPPTRKRPKRNQACPCGSGKKYKKCCLRENKRALDLHSMDERLATDLFRFVCERRPSWVEFVLDELGVDLDEEPGYLQLVVPWLAYHTEEGEGLLLDAYVAASSSLNPRELTWLEAQRVAWLSVWEVLEVKPGVGLSLQDLLTGERRFVHEQLGTQLLRPRHALCGRVVDDQGISTLCGIHPRSLGPRAADEVVEAYRGEMHFDEGDPLSCEALMGEASLVLLEIWEEVVRAWDHRPPPQIQNTDGDPLLELEDRFQLEAGSHRDVADRLAQLPGFEGEDDGDLNPTVFSVIRENEEGDLLENTLVGRVRLEPDELILETNSTRRADALRATVEAVCGQWLNHTARKETDIAAEVFAGMPEGGVDPEPDLPLRKEEQDLVRTFRARLQARWLDTPVPALEGNTPREAADDPGLQPELELLLKEIENFEAKLDPEVRADLSALREALFPLETVNRSRSR